MYKILIVEDDEVIFQQMKTYLERWGYEVFGIMDYSKVAEEFVSCRAQLILMDIGLPFFNGYYWCSQIRQISKVPIIFISSASDNMNIVMAVNMGGDDFIAKPFDLEILSAKVQAILRRTYSFSSNTELLEHEGIILDRARNSVMIHGEYVELTKNEFRILELLFENKGKVVSREKIMQRLWNDECFIDDNTLTVNMTRLRKKLETYGASDVIQTKKGIGYILK